MAPPSTSPRLIITSLLSLVSAVLSQTETRAITCDRIFPSPPVPGVTCSGTGSLATPNVLRDFSLKSSTPVNDCRDACWELGPQCLSYAYHSDGSGRCRLFAKSLIDQGFRANPKTLNVAFWARGCSVDTCKSSVKTTLTNDYTSYDDDFFTINLPFPVTFYGQTTRTLYMSVNGVLSWTTLPGGCCWSNGNLPQYTGSGSTYLPPTALMPFWNDNLIRSADLRSNCNRKQGLSYTITGVNPARTVTFNWQVTYPTAGSAFGYVDVDLLLFENRPDETTFRFNEISSDMGDSATIGSQSQQASKYSVISINSANISPKTRFEFQKGSNYWFEYSF